MIIEEYMDGISFYTDDMEHELAFYSKFTKKITYYRKYYSETCLSFADNLKIINEIDKYRKRCDSE